MEQIQARKAAALVILAAAILSSSGLLVLSSCRRLESEKLGAMVKPDLPVITLKIEVVDSDNKPVPESISVLKSKAAKAAELSDAGGAQPTPQKEGCSGIQGGEKDYAPSGKPADSFGPGCPREASWKIVRHPIAASFYFRDAAAVIGWFKESPEAQELRESRFWTGLLFQPLSVMRVRGEDLQIPNIKGFFLRHFLEDALRAKGELHYDAAHGSKGFVLSFVRSEAGFAKRVLPAIVRGMGRSGYSAPGLADPIVEMMAGTQRLLVAQAGDRIYVGSSLESLLNVLDQLPLPGPAQSGASLLLVLRAEALVKDLLPLLAGRSSWQWEFAFDLSAHGASAGELRLPPADIFSRLRPEISSGVFAAVPQDVFAAAAGSFLLPPEYTAEDYRSKLLELKRPASGAEAAGGAAVVWDINSGETEKLTEVGLIAARAPGSPAGKYESLLSSGVKTGECAGGALFLAASSEALLSRMRESCERRSISWLDIAEKELDNPLDKTQLAFIFNPGPGMLELLMAGQPEELKDESQALNEPEWKVQYRAAAARVREESAKSLGKLPVLIYSGTRARHESEPTILRGFVLSQRGEK